MSKIRKSLAKILIPRTQRENIEQHKYMLDKFNAIPEDIFWDYYEKKYYENGMDDAEFIRDLAEQDLDQDFYQITNKFCPKHTPLKHTPQIWIAPMDKEGAEHLLMILENGY